MSITPKKKNLFKFFKSDKFNRARVNLCAMYILLSKVNELKEDIDSDLQGYDGLYIGDLKRAGKESLAAFEKYVKAYEAHIGSDGLDLANATVDVTTAIDEAMEKNSYYLQEGSRAIKRAIDEQIKNRVTDEEQLSRESNADFEICGETERKQALDATLLIAKRRIDELKGDPLKGAEVGFNVAINWINRLYLEA